MKAQTLIANIGGIMEGLSVLGIIVSYPISYSLYTINLVNTIYNKENIVLNDIHKEIENRSTSKHRVLTTQKNIIKSLNNSNSLKDDKDDKDNKDDPSEMNIVKEDICNESKIRNPGEAIKNKGILKNNFTNNLIPALSRSQGGEENKEVKEVDLNRIVNKHISNKNHSNISIVDKKNENADNSKLRINEYVHLSQLNRDNRESKESKNSSFNRVQGIKLSQYKLSFW
eukprot:CAMPEP_0170535206 /NCGR_PEP_ID=MMETSP0209-20121228/98300_1 /TAXON_ID=665100 ORGANISM="Litonotus pictus, Strain P1" /NCGR_SAMPLE_ID=MMETSP0209 /ASSEMBLY_ACC=CAM_ASM_000301 /LENGTH=227 /DNA_ID=CAMNT_0010835817 /DNA_START=853 /DNA_END=1533 /DNA_ORIENTATION=+